MRIDGITLISGRENSVNIALENGDSLKVPLSIVGDFGLYQGMDLTEIQWQALKDAAGLAGAKMRATRIVAAASVSKADLKRRLLQKGETAEHAEEAVQWLASLSLLDDARMAQEIVERGAAKGYGKNRIRQMLYEKQIPKTYWDTALEQLEAPDAAIDAFLAKKLGGIKPDQKTLKKTIDALIRRGHNWYDIQRGLQRYGAQVDAFLEEE